MEIAIAQLEQEAADDTAFEDTFDLEFDETREIPIPEPIDDQADPTLPYEIAPLQLVRWVD